MKSFVFPLEKVLRWRRQQLEMEEFRFRELMSAVQQLDHARARLVSERSEADRKLLDCPSLEGADLQALAGYRLALERREEALLQERREQGSQLAAQKNRFLEARRRCRLLERLKERHRAEWEALLGRELEIIASESYLARICLHLNRGDRHP